MSHHDPIETAPRVIPSSAAAEPAEHSTGTAVVEPRRGADGLAVTTLVLGIAGFLVITIPVALILGVIAFARAGRQGRKGRGLAAAGLVLAVLWAAGLGAGVMTALNAPTGPERDSRGQINAPAEAAPDSLQVGDCVAEVAEGETATVKAVPCDRDASGKVFAIFTLKGEAWPGDADADQAAGDGCANRYQDDEDAEITFLRPTKEAWAQGDRRVICIAPATP